MEFDGITMTVTGHRVSRDRFDTRACSGHDAYRCDRCGFTALSLGQLEEIDCDEYRRSGALGGSRGAR